MSMKLQEATPREYYDVLYALGGPNYMVRVHMLMGMALAAKLNLEAGIANLEFAQALQLLEYVVKESIPSSMNPDEDADDWQHKHILDDCVARLLSERVSEQIVKILARISNK